MIVQHNLPHKFTIALMGDTHCHTDVHIADRFTPTIDHIIARRMYDNIVLALHPGDLLDGADAPAIAECNVQMARLLAVNIPVATSLGNWEMGTSGSGACPNRINSFGSAYIPYAETRAFPRFLGNYIERDEDDPTATHNGVLDSLDTFAYMLLIGSTRVLFFVTEFGPSKRMRQWIESIVNQYPNFPVFLLSHSILAYKSSNSDDTPSTIILNSPQSDQVYTTSPTAPSLSGLSVTATDADKWHRNDYSNWLNLCMLFSGHVHLDVQSAGQHLDANGNYQFLFTNGDFSDGSTGWTLGTNWAVNSEQLTHTAGSAATTSRTNNEIPCGELCEIFIDVESMSAGSFTVSLGNTVSRSIVSAGLHRFRLRMQANDYGPPVITRRTISITPTSDCDCVINSINVVPNGVRSNLGMPYANLMCDYQSSSGKIAGTKFVTVYPYDNRFVVNTYDTKNKETMYSAFTQYDGKVFLIGA